MRLIVKWLMNFFWEIRTLNQFQGAYHNEGCWEGNWEFSQIDLFQLEQISLAHASILEPSSLIHIPRTATVLTLRKAYLLGAGALCALPKKLVKVKLRGLPGKVENWIQKLPPTMTHLDTGMTRIDDYQNWITFLETSAPNLRRWNPMTPVIGIPFDISTCMKSLHLLEELVKRFEMRKTWWTLFVLHSLHSIIYSVTSCLIQYPYSRGSLQNLMN